jgi:Leucine-rich repeat (LRR) protein
VRNERVIEVSLRDNNLKGSIPSSIGNLTGLNSVDFSTFDRSLPANQLSGSIPSSIGNLVNLKNLRLASNQLSGNIPSSIDNLINLRTLMLNSNQLDGSIPSSIDNLVNLNYLALSYNQLSGSIPSSIGNLANLRYLNLNHNQVSGSIPSSIGNLVNLTQLILYNNQLSESIPSSLGNLVNLAGLFLNNNHLSGSIPPSFGYLRSLRALDLSNNQLSGSVPSSIGNSLHGLTLYLSYNRLSGKIPSSLLSNINGTFLHLSHNYFTFDAMELIAQTFPKAIYAPQKNIPIHQNGNTLSVSAGGTLSNNTYKWFKCEGTTSTLVATIKGDSVFHPSESGKYYVRVLNSVATQLQLYSPLFDYKAPNNLIASSEDALQQSDKTNLFRVYPNPAKDVLHVETNGSATFSLIDQSGKILVRTNITGKDGINISGITPGLYYLKNTSTGNVKKVIIAR